MRQFLVLLATITLMAAPVWAEEVPEVQDEKTEEEAAAKVPDKKPEPTATITFNIQYRKVKTKYIPALHAKAKEQFPQAVIKMIVE